MIVMKFFFSFLNLNLPNHLKSRGVARGGAEGARAPPEFSR